MIHQPTYQVPEAHSTARLLWIRPHLVFVMVIAIGIANGLPRISIPLLLGIMQAVLLRRMLAHPWLWAISYVVIIGSIDSLGIDEPIYDLARWLFPRISHVTTVSALINNVLNDWIVVLGLFGFVVGTAGRMQILSVDQPGFSRHWMLIQLRALLWFSVLSVAISGAEQLNRMLIRTFSRSGWVYVMAPMTYIFQLGAVVSLLLVTRSGLQQFMARTQISSAAVVAGASTGPKWIENSQSNPPAS